MGPFTVRAKDRLHIGFSMSYNKNSYVVQISWYTKRAIFRKKYYGLQDLELALVVKKVGEM